MCKFVKHMFLNDIQKKPLLKYKLSGFKKSSGRNNTGQITVRHKGGGHKRKFRIMDPCEKSSVGIICSVEYDPNRTGFLCCVYDFTGINFYYFLAPEKIRVGDIIKTGLVSDLSLGHTTFLFKMPVGSYIYNVSSVFSKSAGTYCEIKEKTMFWLLVKLPSKTHKIMLPFSKATLGVVSNVMFASKYRRKAGQSRWLNRRPTVRGVAMNPVDHVNGGGNGKKSGQDKTFWGKFNK